MSSVLTTHDRMIQMIESEIAEAGEGWATRLVAEKLGAKLEELERDHFRDWLWERRIEILSAFIGALFKHRRQGSQSRRARFHHAAQDYMSNGDAGVFEQIAPFEIDGQRKREGSLRRPDQYNIAAQYGMSAKRDLLHEKFRRALGRKLTNGRTTEEVMTEEKFLDLLQSITGEEAL